MSASDRATGTGGTGTGRCSHSARLSKPATPATINDVHDLIDRLWAEDGSLSSTDRMRFEAAVIEVTGNIIQHTVIPQGREQVTIVLTLAAEPDRLVATFDDDGEPVPDLPEQPESSEWTDEHGRGLAIVHAMTDDLHYARLPDGRNRWSLTCLRPL